MKAKIEVTYLPNVEDPEALSIERNLSMLGYNGIKGLSIKKIYEFTLDDDSYNVLDEIAGRILTNPVIQSYKIIRD
ncbi:phosphoribosylformylglycinamidine synthase subunit PurS [Picrophilus oshimae]|uniref:Phosphoribosylformylglycinamidine synthase subunit PurS n=1 Tax=Picrophilus torridus (strain ATCC 700027 / DSM 9790 / JCM 10055 / NBRC 100828 / KAW 2/3) TaxID=1122961 RepID=A0A8G2FX64_PICTO|nr:phosphoribosylformylglycinamidine synthase subunit PurS [Picrophilus oshimae]SMD31144.1 phosphoribosylformylglycinamidine synthase [Picrophilus oshimae DSM 9789]